MKVQEKYAMPMFYEKLWPHAQIKATDKMVKESPLWKKRDFNGLDKIVFLPDGNEIHLAQRFRSADSKNDFSLRYEVPDKKGGIQKSEYFKLKRAYKEDLWLPDRYAFGNTTFGKKFDESGSPVVPDVSRPFKDFYIFKVKPLIRNILNGRIKMMGPYDNVDKETGRKNGSSGVYCKVNGFPSDVFEYEFDLEDKGRKLEEFEKEEIPELDSEVG